MSQEVISDLGGGLVLRRGRPADAEPLVEFNANVLHRPAVPPPEWGIGGWARDLAARPHPGCTVRDFTVVEDTRTGAIVSSLCLIRQVWTYGGVELPVGRPELVSTHPDYRGRGLVRAQFEAVHRWSAERGDLLQVL